MLKPIVQLLLIQTFALFIFTVSAQPQTFEKKSFVPQPKEGQSRYAYIPFEMPRNAHSVTVSYEYDKKGGANVLDLGVFDSRFSGADTDTRGFRGWSGGRRNTIFISETAATNGYIAGKIPAGTWRVILGLYKVAAEGVEVTVRVRVNEIDPEAQKILNDERSITFSLPAFRPSPAPLQANGYTWYRGDLHTHTFHSDGSWTLPMILAWSRASGLNFVSITEHNTFSHHAELDALIKNQQNLLVLRGEEVTTYGGHFNVWGLPSGALIDFRVTPKNTAALQNIVTDVHKRGLLASLNHPTAPCGGCDWSYGDWTTMDSVEVWNGNWDLTDENALKQWDAILQTGKRLTAIGSSDSHVPPLGEKPPINASAIGEPTTSIGTERLTQKELFAAIKAGRVFISQNPNLSVQFSAQNNRAKAGIGEEIATKKNGEINFRAAAGDSLGDAKLLLIANGKIAAERRFSDSTPTQNFTVEFEKSGYARLEVRAANGKMLAFTNPIRVRVTL